MWGIPEFRQISGLVKETKEDTKSSRQALVFPSMDKGVDVSVLWLIAVAVTFRVRSRDMRSDFKREVAVK